MNKIIRSSNLTKVYGEKETSVKALDDISVEFSENEFTAIMGPSGSGKSTCLLYTSPSPRDKRQSRMPSSA